jgi:NADH dehydrogenase
MLFYAARQAGVKRIVHVSITNPSLESPLPYFRGKALVEHALAQCGVPYTVVRPTLVFGGERDVLVNNIAWILRRMPAFALPGDGSYRVQPVHVDDLARICTEAGAGTGDRVIDAAGPETMSFRDLVAGVRGAVDTRSPILRLPAPVMLAAARALGLLVKDVVLTADEIRGLMAGLLVSHDPARGRIAFSDWLDQNSAAVGRVYANELQRHFATTAA